MKNQNFFPIERNRYFYGKLLTVSDFDSEQKYFNDKRRLINRLVLGAGVACGLNVVKVDDMTISVEKGLALDYTGRELIIDTPILKKLSVIDGFNDMRKNKNVYLCIEYDEKQKEPVHAVQVNSEESISYNKFLETYRIYLTDVAPDVSTLTLEGLYEDKKVIFTSDEVTLTMVVPRYAEQKGKLELQVIVDKTQSAAPILFNFNIISKFLIGQDQKDEKKDTLKITFDENTVKPQDKYILKYVFDVEDVGDIQEVLKIEEDSFLLNINNKRYKLNSNQSFVLNIICGNIKDELKKDYFSMNMDDRIQNIEDHKLYLAKISLVDTGTTYIIDSIENNPFNQYILGSQLVALLDKVQEYKVNGKDREFIYKKTKELSVLEGIGYHGENYVNMNSGVEDIDIDINPKSNGRHISREIVHELGQGYVCIVVALEHDVKKGKQGEAVYFGSQDVFDKTDYEDDDCIRASIGVIAYPDKGTFRIGVRLLKNTEAHFVRVRWWAYRDEISAEKDMNKFGKSITISPDILTLEVRERGKFNAIVTGVNDNTCKWSIGEGGTGNIDENGVYTAPSECGVYEIVAESVYDSSLKATAFVVVKDNIIG